MAVPRGQGWKRDGQGGHTSTDGTYRIFKAKSMMGDGDYWAVNHTADPATHGPTYVGGWNNLRVAKDIAAQHRVKTVKRAADSAERQANHVPLTDAQMASGLHRLSASLGKALLPGGFNDRRNA